MKALLATALVFLWWTALAQPQTRSVVIGSMTTRPNALLIVNPQNSNQGVLLPQLTTGQRMSMRPSSPQEDGLIVYDKNANAYYYWSGGAWRKMNAETSAQTKVQSIDPASFQVLQTGKDIRHNNIVIFESDNSFVTASRDESGEDIIAPVNLPHGTRLSEVIVYYFDNDDRNIKVTLSRKSLGGGSEEILSWESSGASPVVKNVALTNFAGKETIDLENFTYRLIVKFDIRGGEEIDTPAKASQRLYSIKLKYLE